MPDVSSTNGWTRLVKDKIKLKIVSDGTSNGTHVVDRETGEELKDIMEIEWRITVGNIAEVILTMRNVPVELTVIEGMGKTGISKAINRTYKRRIELEK
jgi:hypothetical protein